MLRDGDCCNCESRPTPDERSRQLKRPDELPPYFSLNAPDCWIGRSHAGILANPHSSYLEMGSQKLADNSTRMIVASECWFCLLAITEYVATRMRRQYEIRGAKLCGTSF
jgi:hypothetical protein